MNAQTDTIYTVRLAKASLFHLQKNYKAAIWQYEKAFADHQPNALNAYKAAAVYSLDSNADKALQYLELAIKKGYTEADWLMADPYFQYLREKAPQQWTRITSLVQQAEQQYAQT